MSAALKMLLLRIKVSVLLTVISMEAHMRKIVSFARTLPGFALAAAGATIAVAPLSPALGAPIIAGAVYNEAKSQSCTAPNCFLTFTQIPAGKHLVVTNVSCSIQTRNAPNIPQISFRQTIETGNYYLAPIFRGNRTAGGDVFRDYVSNDAVSLIVRSTSFPRVTVLTFAGQGSVVAFDCMISGVLKPTAA
jgi:hypothetical protein